MYEQLNTFLHLLRSLDWNRSVYQAKLSLTQKLVFYFKIACSNRVSPKWGPDLDPASLKNPIINFCSSPVVQPFSREDNSLGQILDALSGHHIAYTAGDMSGIRPAKT